MTQATKAANQEVTTLTHAEWLAEGERLFGSNREDWAFECPLCHHVAQVKDFRDFKDKGATANTAMQACMGRYDPSAVPMFRCDGKNKPCDYAGYGLFRFSPVRVVMDDGEEVHCFAFATPA